MKRFTTFTLRFVFILGAAHAIFADPLQWNLSTLTLAETSYHPPGVASTGTMTGSVTYDADTNVYTTWSIELTGFPGTGVPASGLLLTPENTSACVAVPGFPCYYPTEIVLLSTVPGPFEVLDLFFAQPLTDAGGTIPISTDDLYLDVPEFGTFSLQSPGGSVSTAPEPSSAALTLTETQRTPPYSAAPKRTSLRQAHSGCQAVTASRAGRTSSRAGWPSRTRTRLVPSGWGGVRKGRRQLRQPFLQ
jgi:hypothetical protein